MKNTLHPKVLCYLQVSKTLHFCLLFFITSSTYIIAQGVRINEIMPSNSISLVDEDGDFSDWIELYNSSSTSINLYGYTITDDEDDLSKWTFPNIDLAPQQFLIVFASGKDRPQGELHTNFKLKSSGETLILTSSTGVETDRLIPPALGEDMAYGRIPDGNSFVSQLYTPSPDISNNDNDGISFSHKAGYYQEEFQLSVQTQNKASTIYYTLDGSLPSPEAILCDGAVIIEDQSSFPNQIANINNSPYDFFSPSVTLFKGTVLRMQAYRNGIPVSPVMSKTYFVHPEIFTKYTLPIVSVITAPENLFDEETGIYVPGNLLDSGNPLWTGNYFQRGEAWEKESVLHYFDLAGELELEQNFGLRIHGGKTRGRRQKSFRCYARKEYGASTFQHRLIADKDKEEFKRFILQSPIGGWNHSMIKDVATHEISKGLDFDVQHTQPVIMFLNGEYWGIYFIRDRYDEYYLEEEYGLDEDDVDILVHGAGIRPDGDENWGTLLGSNTEYRSLMLYMDENDMTTSDSYEYFKSQVNINSFLDYYCTQIYFNNKDWPRNNHEVWRSKDEDSPYHGWRWWLFDVDGGWGYLGSHFNLLEYASHPTGTAWQNPPYATFLLRKLLENPYFQEDFLQRFACLMQNEFQADNVIEVVERLRNWLEPEMQDHVNRWGYVSSVNSWHGVVDERLIDFAQERQAFMIEHIKEAFVLDSFNLEQYCSPITTSQNLDLAPRIILFPNPARDLVNIKFLDLDNTTGQAQLFDIIGKRIRTLEFDSDFQLDLQYLASGTYTLVINTNNEQIVKKVVKM